MTRSKHVIKPYSSNLRIVESAWPRNDTNVSNTCFFKPSDFVLPKTLLLEILGHYPCRYAHSDFLMASRILFKLEKQLMQADSEGDITEMLSQSEMISEKELPSDSKKTRVKAKQVPSHDPHRIKRIGSRVCIRRAIHLTIHTVKYSRIIQQLLDLCDFYTANPDLREDAPLVRVIICDFLERRLEIRTPFINEIYDEHCGIIEKAIKSMHIRICADFARMRINERTRNLQDMVEDKIKEMDRAVKKMPLFVWVNQCLISVSEAIKLLEDFGFNYCPTPSSRAPGRSKFHPDVHCYDVLLFNQFDADELDCLYAFKQHQLNIGDKLECLSLYLIIEKTNPKMTIALVNPNSVFNGLHAESLFVAKHGKHAIEFRKAIRMIFTGTQTKSVEEEIRCLEEAGSKTLMAYEDVANAGKWPVSDMVFIYGLSSMTGIIDPKEYLVFSERSDSAMLYNVIEYSHNAILDGQTPVFLRTNLECMKRAFETAGLKHVFFLAHSIRSAETSQLVQKSIEMANQRSHQTSDLVWTLSSPVRGDFQSTDYITITSEKNGIFASPSRECNGGFFCAMERQISKEFKKNGTNASNKITGFVMKQENLHNSDNLRYEKCKSSAVVWGLKDPTSSVFTKRRHGMDSSTTIHNDDLEVMELSSVDAKV